MSDPIPNSGHLPHTIISYDDLVATDQLVIEHDGSATWADLQAVKNAVWGDEALAIEIYPPKSTVVNGGSTEFHFRHLWRFPVWMSWPNMRPEGSF